MFEMTNDRFSLKGGLRVKRHKFIILMYYVLFFRHHLLYRVSVSSLHFD